MKNEIPAIREATGAFCRSIRPKPKTKPAKKRQRASKRIQKERL